MEPDGKPALEDAFSGERATGNPAALARGNHPTVRCYIQKSWGGATSFCRFPNKDRLFLHLVHSWLVS